jgi:hypothetical protein
MFQNQGRESLFLQELRDLKVKAAAASTPLASAMDRQLDREPFSVAEDTTQDKKEKRLQLQQQTMRHFSDFSEKFSLLPKQDNKGINLSAAWWGKSPASYLNNAQHGFFKLPANLKLDPGNSHFPLQ